MYSKMLHQAFWLFLGFMDILTLLESYHFYSKLEFSEGTSLCKLHSSPYLPFLQNLCINYCLSMGSILGVFLLFIKKNL